MDDETNTTQEQTISRTRLVDNINRNAKRIEALGDLLSAFEDVTPETIRESALMVMEMAADLQEVFTKLEAFGKEVSHG